MRTVLTYLPALACGAMMVVCVRMMARSHGAMDADQKTEEIAELRDEVARLRAERELANEKEPVDG